MAISPSAPQLRKHSTLLQSIARLQHEGNTIPPNWLDSTLHNAELFSPLALSKAHDNIEREIEQALYENNKLYKKNSSPLQKILNPTPRAIFNFANAAIAAVTVKELYQQIYIKSLHRAKGIELTLTAQQFAQLRPSLTHIMCFHGNQALTGSPYFEGGIPNIVLFQWGNLLGIAKFTAAPSEKVIKGDLLVYFEDLQDRTIEECAVKYQHQHRQLIKQITAPALILPQPIAPAPSIIATQEPLVTVPTISLGMMPSASWNK